MLSRARREQIHREQCAQHCSARPDKAASFVDVYAELIECVHRGADPYEIADRDGPSPGYVPGTARTELAAKHLEDSIF